MPSTAKAHAGDLAVEDDLPSEVLPYPTGLSTLLSLETRLATVVYWASVLGIALSVFIPTIPPLVDYPQHIAMAELARQLADASSPLHESFTLDYFTYNSLFQWLVTELGHVVPVEIGGKVVVAAALSLLGGANVALLRTLGRPPGYAALFIPVLFASPVVWGFINYVLGVALAVVTLVFVARGIMRPSPITASVAAALSLLSGFCHVLAAALLCVLAVSIAPEIAWRATRHVAARGRRILHGIGRGFVGLAPLLVGGLYCIAVFLEQYDINPTSYSNPTHEGTGPTLASRLYWFSAYTTGLHSDKSDQGIVLAMLALLALILVAGLVWRVRGDRPVVLLGLTTVGIYLCIPMVFVGTHVIFPRFGQTVVFGLLFLLPRLRERWAPFARGFALSLACLASVNLAVHMVRFAEETQGLSEVIDAMPAGRKATAVIYDPSTTSFRHGVLIHAAAYYGARKGGEWSFNFARYQSLPLAFVPGSQPAWPRKGWEFYPEHYNPRCGYARYYALVLVQAPIPLDDQAEQTVRKLVFGPDASVVKLIARSGRYFAFDTQWVPYDGTP